MTIIGQYYSNSLPVAGGATNSFLPIASTTFYHGLREVYPISFSPIGMPLIHQGTQWPTIQSFQSHNRTHSTVLTTSSPIPPNYVNWDAGSPLGISISFDSPSSTQTITEMDHPIILKQLYRIQSIEPGSIADTMGINTSTPLHQYVAYRGVDGRILRQPLATLISERTTYMLRELSQTSTPDGSPKNRGMNIKSILKPSTTTYVLSEMPRTTEL